MSDFRRRNRFCGIVDIDEAFCGDFFLECLFFPFFSGTSPHVQNALVAEQDKSICAGNSTQPLLGAFVSCAFSESWATPPSRGEPGSHVVLDRMSFHTVCNGAAPSMSKTNIVSVPRPQSLTQNLSRHAARTSRSSRFSTASLGVLPIFLSMMCHHAPFPI